MSVSAPLPVPDSLSHSRSFFVTGGTLPCDAACYVCREADAEIFRELMGGEFCYVLTARQMGKSSLTIRTAARLRETGVAAVVLDLTALGINVTPDQWYLGQLRRIGRQLGMEEELTAFWAREDNRALGPFLRWMAALTDVVLLQAPGRIVIFLDEIDVVRSLPFSTDEFFAGIRAWYNRRPDEPTLCRLSFCLLGVATPSELIQDVRNTPFNIGRRIELRDFTAVEVVRFAAGLTISGHNKNEAVQSLLDRVYFWTAGHPYLTQRLCQAIAASDVGDRDVVAAVDRHCEQLFLSRTAREADDNLLFVRERLLRSDADPVSVLDAYQRLLKDRPIQDDENSPVTAVLRLSGIATRNSDGRLRVRNRIYRTVFNFSWAAAQMPDAEIQRQRRAYRLGLIRALSASAVVVSLVGGLAVSAYVASGRASRAESRVRRELFIADMNLAWNAYDANNLRRLRELVGQHQAVPAEANRLELRLLEALANEAEATFSPPGTRTIAAVAVTPDGKTMLAADPEARTLIRYAVGTGSPKKADTTVASVVLTSFATAEAPDKLWAVTFSRDGQQAAVAGGDRCIRVYDLDSQRQRAVLHVADGDLPSALAFDPGGRRLASGDYSGRVRVWDLARGASTATFADHRGPVKALAFSQNDLLASGGFDGNISLRHVGSGARQRMFRGHKGTVTSLAFSEDGQAIVSGGKDGTVRLWNPLYNLASRILTTDSGQRVDTVALSACGRWIAAGGYEGAIQLWDARTGQILQRLHGHLERITALTFSPADGPGLTLVSGAEDGTLRRWCVIPLSLPSGASPFTMALSPDGNLAALFYKEGSYEIRLVETRTGTLRTRLSRPHQRYVWALAFSPDNSRLATGSGDHTVRLWDITADGIRPSRNGGPLSGHADEVHSVAFSPDGRWLASGDAAGVVALRDGQRGTVRDLWRPADIPANQGNLDRTDISLLAFSPDGQWLTAASRDHDSTFVYDIRSRSTLTCHGGSGRRASSVAFSEDGNLLAIGYQDGLVLVYELSSHRERYRLSGHRDVVAGIAFSADGKTLVTSSGDGQLKFWDVAMGKETLVFTKPFNQKGIVPGRAMRLSRDGSLTILDKWGRGRSWVLNRKASR
jgi:WD40 repeat protein